MLIVSIEKGSNMNFNEQTIGFVIIPWLAVLILPVLVLTYRHRIAAEWQFIFWTLHLFYLFFAVCALTIGIPVPFAGWGRGWKVFLGSPLVLTLCMCFFPPLPAILIGIGFGMSRLFYPRKPPNELRK
jgi:hypothetical protein